MNDEILKKYIEELRQDIKSHSYEYYDMNNSNISDYEFDCKMKTLEYLEKNYPYLKFKESPSKIIGEYHHTLIKNVHHRYKMYSLQNSYNYNELVNWEKKIKKILYKIEYICEYKYDGISINLIYENGILKYGSTRGNGSQGENITDNIKTIKSIPLKIESKCPKYLEIHGEIVLSKKNYDFINKKRFIDGKKNYSNSRNLVSGIIKNKNINEISKIPLDCFVYAIYGSNISFSSQYDLLNYAKNIYGFKVSEKYILSNNINDVYLYIQNVNKSINNLKYVIDGIVIKINNFNFQLKLGYTSKYPRWAIAYKYRTDIISTKLINVTFQVGRSGIITPVAELKPILINGTIVKRASLYNIEYIKKLDIHYNDIVYVEKGGDIIPKIIGINIKKRNLYSSKVTFIKNCPSCNYILKYDKKSVYCTNETKCYSIIIKKIDHFVKIMKIYDIGIKTIENCVKSKILNNISDLFFLKKDQLINIENISNKTAENIINNIKNTKYNSFEEIIFALGIDYVGENTAKIIARNFNNIDSIIESNIESLKNIKLIGKKIITNIVNFFSKKDNINIIKRLSLAGVNLKNDKKIQLYNKKILNKKFVFTGKLLKFNRAKAEKMIEYNGGFILRNISKNVDFLVKGIGKNGIKFKKSIKIKNINIINEEDFLNLFK